MTHEEYPSAPQLEKVILGSVMLNGTVMDGLRTTMETDDFHLVSHKRIWDSCCRVYDKGVTVDRIAVCHDLRERDELDVVGGFGYLIDLDAGLPEFPSLDYHISVLKEKTLLRRMLVFGDSMIKRALSGMESADELRAAFVDGITHLRAADDRNQAISTRALVKLYGIDGLLNPKLEEGIRLPWDRLSRAICGMRGGQMITLAAYTGRGKSCFACQAATHVTRQAKAAFIVTTEMPARQLFQRMIDQIANIDSHRRYRDLLSPTDRERQRDGVFWLNDHPVYFDERSRTVPAILANLRQAQSEADIGLVVIDHLQHLRSPGHSESRTREVGNNSRALKLAAMDFNLPFLVLSQVSRPNGDDSDIGLHSLKESGDIENDSDVVLLLNGPQSEEAVIPMRVRVAKQREGPSGFEIPLNFHAPSTAFYSPESD
jgi:replicative DNA helicase